MIVSIPDPNHGAPFTDTQGQYLAFIYAYAKIHRRPPAEADMQRFFGVTAPSVHRMVLELEKRGLIHRKPGKAAASRCLSHRKSYPSCGEPLHRELVTTPVQRH